jgi:hypothetical protein
MTASSIPARDKILRALSEPNSWGHYTPDTAEQLVKDLETATATAVINSFRKRAAELAVPMELIDFFTGAGETAAVDPAAVKPRDRFKVTHMDADGNRVFGDEIECLDCGSHTAMGGVFEPTLAQIDAMAGRHECLPRF